MVAYSIEDVRRGYAWLAQKSYTEITVLHPGFRRDDPSWNTRHDAWPRTDYVTCADGLLEYVRRYAGERLVCYGVNPRPQILAKPDGRLRSATTGDIDAVQTVVFDIDCLGTAPPTQLRALDKLLENTAAYWHDVGTAAPVRACSGNGYHLLFAVPPIATASHPAIGAQLRAFRSSFVRAHRAALDNIGAVVDGTVDVARKLKVYGTGKPGSKRISTFPNVPRVPDVRLREYLLSLPAESFAGTAIAVDSTQPVPVWFSRMLDEDRVVRNLWDGTGKESGDVSRSGYDWALVRLLVTRGHANADELASILNLRSGKKGRPYVTHTVQQALARQMTRKMSGGAS